MRYFIKGFRNHLNFSIQLGVGCDKGKKKGKDDCYGNGKFCGIKTKNSRMTGQEVID